MFEPRKHPRKPLNRPAWIINPPSAPIACTIDDIADDGARVIYTSLAPLPDRFILSLTEDQKAARACEVVWRNGQDVGLRFTGRPSSQPQADIAILDV